MGVIRKAGTRDKVCECNYSYNRGRSKRVDWSGRQIQVYRRKTKWQSTAKRRRCKRGEMRAIICKLTRAGFIAPLMIQSLLLALKKAKRFACASVIGAIGSTYISFQLVCKWLEMSHMFQSWIWAALIQGMYLLRTKVMRKSECFLVSKQWNLIEWFDLASGPPKWSVVNISWNLESLVTIQTVCDSICRITEVAY